MYIHLIEYKIPIVFIIRSSEVKRKYENLASRSTRVKSYEFSNVQNLKMTCLLWSPLLPPTHSFLFTTIALQQASTPDKSNASLTKLIEGAPLLFSYQLNATAFIRKRKCLLGIFVFRFCAQYSIKRIDQLPVDGRYIVFIHLMFTFLCWWYK